MEGKAREGDRLRPTGRRGMRSTMQCLVFTLNGVLYDTYRHGLGCSLQGAHRDHGGDRAQIS